MTSFKMRALSRSPYSKYHAGWKTEFLSNDVGPNTTQCLVCGKLVVCKKYNIKRHYDFCHGAQYNNVVGEDRQMLIDRLIKAVNSANNPENESAGSSETKDKEDKVRISKGGLSALSQAVQSLQEISNQNCTLNEFQTFGQHIAAQLEQLPLKDALELETDIIGLVTARRMKLLKEDESEGNIPYEHVEEVDIKSEIVPHM